MAWPPPLRPIDRTDSTLQQTTHKDDHNGANLAINDLVARVSRQPPITTRSATGYAATLMNVGTVLAELTVPEDLNPAGRIIAVSYNCRMDLNAQNPIFYIALVVNTSAVMSYAVPAGPGLQHMINFTVPYEMPGASAAHPVQVKVNAVDGGGTQGNVYADPYWHKLSVVMMPGSAV